MMVGFWTSQNDRKDPETRLPAPDSVAYGGQASSG